MLYYVILYGNVLGLRHMGTLHGLPKSLRNTWMTAWSEKQDQSMDGFSPSHLVVIEFDP